MPAPALPNAPPDPFLAPAHAAGAAEAPRAQPTSDEHDADPGAVASSAAAGAGEQDGGDGAGAGTYETYAPQLLKARRQPLRAATHMHSHAHTP
jgi:hypothetical protein